MKYRIKIKRPDSSSERYYAQVRVLGWWFSINTNGKITGFWNQPYYFQRETVLDNIKKHKFPAIRPKRVKYEIVTKLDLMP